MLRVVMGVRGDVNYEKGGGMDSRLQGRGKLSTADASMSCMTSV